MNGENQSLIERFGAFFSRVFDLWNETLEHVRTIRAYTTRDTQTVVSDSILIFDQNTTGALTVPDFAKLHVLCIRYTDDSISNIETYLTVKAFRNAQLVSTFTIFPACFMVGAVNDALNVVFASAKVEVFGHFNKFEFERAAGSTNYRIQIISYT
jgi:hypothetical protein